MRENRFSILMLAFALLVSVEVVLHNLDRAGVPAGQSEFASRADFGINELRELITQNNLNTVEQTLEKLPPELLRNYTLQHTSISLQEASPQNPRAVLFMPNGSLILTFNGNSRQKGFDQIEAASFDPLKDEISFYEVDFDRRGRHAPVFSKPNPAKCMNCHGGEGKAPRYVWTGYNHWNGSYGQIDDRIHAPNDEDQNKKILFNNFLENEDKEFQKFKMAAPTHPRYKFLYQSAKEPQWPYHTGVARERKIALLPNFRVESLMTTNYIKSLARELFSRKHFNEVRMTYLFLNLCSDYGSVNYAKAYDRITQFSRLEYPQWARGSAYKNDVTNLVLGDRVRFLDFQLNPNNRDTRITRYETGGSMVPFLLAFEVTRRMLAMDPSLAQKLPMQEMFSDAQTYGGAPPAAYLPADFPEDLEIYLATQIATQLPNFPPTTPGQHFKCDVLAELAQKEMSRPLPPSTQAPAKDVALNGPQILQKYGCVGCHSARAYGIGPEIPFGDEAELREIIRGRSPMSSGAVLPDEVRYRVRWPKLSRSGSSAKHAETLSALHDHMPRGGGYLSEKEEAALVDYLNGLGR